MKKIIIIFILLLVGLAVVLSIWGRGDNYSIEKQIWAINQEFLRVSKDPKTIPSLEYEKIAKEYRAFIDKHADSKLASSAYTLLGRLYVTKKDYSQARVVFEEVIGKYPKDIRLCARALIDIGKTYALEKDDKNLLKTYERAIKEYPLTDFGMSAPLVIAKFYVDKEDKDQAQKAYKDAISHYLQLAKQYKNTVIEFHALRLIASTYVIQEKWEQSLRYFKEALLRFGDQEYMTLDIANRLLKSINTISVLKLNSVDYPIDVYTTFMEKYPDHKFNKVLANMVKVFKGLKQKVDNAENQEEVVPVLDKEANALEEKNQ